MCRMSWLLTGHSRLVAVQAVDHDGLRLVDFHAAPDALRELARRQLGRIDLLDEKLLGIDHRL